MRLEDLVREVNAAYLAYGDMAIEEVRTSRNGGTYTMLSVSSGRSKWHIDFERCPNGLRFIIMSDYTRG